ncbi:MAG: DUF2520 domain-containing protein [Arthrobacter sp.]|jgi:predicted short-subunit dehydrogenase-like oxidoreductase (DUF2520 family)|nr:DUF2520 domain-containing protein [Arthrobacter sp.]
MSKPGRLGFGIIGAGAVGPVLGAALRGAEHAVVGIHAVSEDSRERAEAMLPGVPLLDIPEVLRRCEAVLLAVPDDALGPLVSGLAEAGQWRAGQLVLHTSARFGVDVLTPAREAGVIPLALHPAMAFTGTSLDQGRLTGVSWGVSADPIMLPVAQALVVEMGGEPVVIEEEDRGLYAAALQLVGETVGAVEAIAWEALASVGVEDPSRFMGTLLRSGVENALMAGPRAAKASAVAAEPGRVRSAVRAWGRWAAEGSGGAGGDEAASYAALVRAATARAVRRGDIDAQRAAAVLAALDD